MKRMRKILLVLLFLPLSFSLFSQKLAEGIYWLKLADKANNEYSLSAPTEFLSQRALDRRIRQNINLSIEDLPISKIYLDSLKSLGLDIMGGSKWFNAMIIKTTDTLLLDTLDHLSFVSKLHLKIYRKKAINYNQLIKEPGIQNEIREFSKLDYGKAYPQIALVNGIALHDLGYRGDDFQIAVIDGGFYRADSIAAFDSLWNEGRLLGYRDFSRSPKTFFQTSSHGMSVLSTMAANVPGEIIGTAPKASYWLLKSEIVESETPLEEALWTLAAEFADSAGVDIISSSLGYSQFDDPSMNYSYSEMDGKTCLVTRAAEKAFSKGIIVVISAGNEGNKSWKHLTAPSDGPNVLAVGAIDTSGKVAGFSSRGPSADFRVKPDVLAVGYKTMVVNSAGFVSPGSGTSFSAPQISGMIACLWQASPKKTNLEVIQSVKRSASLYYNPNDSAGYGAPDFMKALLILNLGVPELQANKLSVIPNPNRGVFEIFTGVGSFEDAKVSIYNLTGKKIYSGIKSFASGSARISEMEGFDPGMYFLVAESKGKKFYTNVIVLKP